ncbi:IS66 family transposase [Turicibacter sp. H121]|uniref:IS66 family transposase n=1 Tax=Turicibacter sp. H121 TaxID=1712675 RepID=UPI0009E93FFA
MKNLGYPIPYYHANLTLERAFGTTILDELKRSLNCEGYSGYKNILNINLVGCWAHVRRNFLNGYNPSMR